jgi:hypothetical protein
MEIQLGLDRDGVRKLGHGEMPWTLYSRRSHESEKSGRCRQRLSNIVPGLSEP